MKLRRISINNLHVFPKGFSLDVGECTVAIGANNAGKTGLLTLINPNLSTPMRRSAERASDSCGREFDLWLSPEDVEESVRARPNVAVLATAESDPDPLPYYLRQGVCYRITIDHMTSNRLCRPAAALQTNVAYVYNRTGGKLVRAPNASHANQDSIGEWVLSNYPTRILHLDSARRPTPTAAPAPVVELSPSASNLIEVLDQLQPKTKRYASYIGNVRSILPEIARIEILSSGSPSGHKEIQVSTFEDGVPDDELLFPLSSFGAGTTQILALVYAITNSSKPRIILIDEPGTYLHPGAVRELFRLIARNSHHQYIIATHTVAALMDLPQPSVVLLQRDVGRGSEARNVNWRDLTERRHLLEAVGASLQDVLAADRLIWVEGATERDVFEEIVRKAPDELGRHRGTVFLYVTSTDAFYGKDAERIAEMYQRLSQQDSLMPRTVAFVLDREGKTEKVREDLVRRLPNRVLFIPGGRMLENNFLDETLVREMFESEAQRWDTVAPSKEAIASYWNSLAGTEYKTNISRTVDPVAWKREVHGATVLSNTVAHFTENRARYDKRSHGVLLAQLALEFDPSLLDELTEMLRTLLSE